MNPRQISNLAVPSFSHFSPSSPPKKRVYYEVNTVFIISSHECGAKSQFLTDKSESLMVLYKH